MRKKFKLLAMLLTVVIATSMVLTGCGGSEKPAQQDSAAKTEEPAPNDMAKSDTTGESEAKKEPVKVMFYREYDEATLKARKEYDVVAEFEKQNPGIKVEMKSLVANTSSEEYKKKADLMLASGEQMDIIMFSNMHDIVPKVSAGLLEPLNSFADKEGIKLDEEYMGMIPMDGNFYTIPTQYSMWIVFINKDMLDAAGLPLPPADWTWDDYREYAKKLTKGEGKEKVYGSYMHTWDEFYSVGLMNKIEKNLYYKEDGTSNFDHPVFRDFMKLRYEMESVEKTQIPFIDIKTQKMAYRSIFFSGKVAMMPQGTWMLSDIGLTEKYPHTFKTTFATWPRADKNSKTNFTMNSAAGIGFAINAGSKCKDETYKFLRFFTSKGFDMTKSMLSPWKKGDHLGILKGIMGQDESLYDLDPLTKIINDPNKKDNTEGILPVYTAEVLAAWGEECEKYFIGDQDLDTTMNSTIKRANEIIEKNKQK